MPRINIAERYVIDLGNWDAAPDDVLCFYDQPLAFRRLAMVFPVPASVPLHPLLSRRPIVPADWALASAAHGLVITNVTMSRFFGEGYGCGVERWLIAGVDEPSDDADKLCKDAEAKWLRGDALTAVTINGIVRRIRWKNEGER